MKYEIRFINGHTMKYEVRKVDADNQMQAVSKLWDGRGDFDHQILTVLPIESEPLKFKALGYEIEIKATKYNGEDDTLLFMNEIMGLLSHTEDALRAKHTENGDAVADIRWKEFEEIYDQLDEFGYWDEFK